MNENKAFTTRFDLPQLGTTALLSVLLIARNWPRLISPEPMMDDATEMFASAVCSGVAETFTPFAGSLLVFPRLLTLAAWQVVPQYVFQAQVWFSTLIFAWVCARFVGSANSSLVPSTIVRFFMCLAFALGPGSTEVSGLVTGLSYSFALLIALWLLENQTSWSKARYAVLATSVISSHLASINFLLAFMRYRSTGLAHYRVVGLVCFANLVIHSALTVISDNNAVGPSTISPFSVLLGLVDRIAIYSFVLTTMGPSLAAPIVQNTASYLLLLFTGGIIIWYSWKSVRMDSEFKTISIALIAMLSFFYTLHMLSRPYSLSPRFMPMCFAPSRYSFLGFDIGLILVIGTLFRLKLSPMKLFATSAWIALQSAITLIELWSFPTSGCPASSRSFLAELIPALNGSNPGQNVEFQLLVGPVAPVNGETCNVKGAHSILRISVENGVPSCSSAPNEK